VKEVNVAIRPGLPKLVATDLDGTIVRSDETVSRRTRAAFDRLCALGIPIVGVTGRGPRLLDLCRQDLPSASFFVLAQGAHVLDMTGEEPITIFSDSMPGSLVGSVIDAIEAVAGPVTVLAEPVDATDSHLVGEVHPAWRFQDAVRACDRAEALDRNVIKAFAHSDSLSADELLEVGREVTPPGLVELTQAGLGYVEICPPGVTKASGLAVVATALGVDAADVLVFGDMPNDLPMFGWAGWSRVAVANAHPLVLAAADEVTLANDEDGVAVYLSRLLSRGEDLRSAA
jgi:Cof subfamily protein (haloacid dehalogenase superfamily)